VPVLSYLDDLILVPLGIALAVRLVPPDVMAACRAQARADAERPTNWAVALVIVSIWLAVSALGIWLIVRATGR
jgi:hypothetical protein